MLKIKDSSGALVATLDDQDSEPEVTDAGKAKVKQEEQQEEGVTDVSSDNINVQ
jgi:hypothetical protein